MMHLNCIDAIPVGLSAIAAVTVQKEQVAQFGGTENRFPKLVDGGCVCVGGTGMDAGDVPKDGLDAFFADACCRLGFCADVQTTLTECFSQCVDVKVFDQDHRVVALTAEIRRTLRAAVQARTMVTRTKWSRFSSVLR